MSLPGAPSPVSATRWTRGVLAIFAMLGFGFGSWLSRIPAVRDHLGASTLEMSYIGLVLASGCVIGLLLAGRSVAWLGPRRALIIGIVAQLITMPVAALLLWGGMVVPAVAVLALYGFFFSTCDVAMNVSGAEAERALGRPRMPLMHAGYSLGSVSATGLGALVEAARVPVPLHLTLVFVVIAVGGFVALRSVPPDRGTAPDAPGSPTEPAHDSTLAPNTHTGPIQIAATGAATHPIAKGGYSPWRDSRILLVASIALSVSLAEGGASDWLPLAMADGRGLPNSVATLILSTFFIAMMLGRVAGSWALQRFGRVASIRATAVLLALGVAIVITVPVTWAAFVGAALWGIGSSLGFPVAVSAAADDPEKSVPRVATVTAIAYTAMLLGPMGFGFLGEHVGLLQAFWPLIGVAIFACFAAPSAREPGRLGQDA